MGDALPESEAEVRDAIVVALADGAPLELLGAGSRRGFGKPVEASSSLSMRLLARIISYEPAELTLTAQAGARLLDVLDLLDRNGQQFAFEPIDHSLFYGGAPFSGTLGGMIATNASGPRRVKAGAARDHLLGFRGVTGRGELIKSGGRVMKNVTGYDLSKLVSGSHGSLVALTEATFKVSPKPDTQSTVLVYARNERLGLLFLREASQSALDASSFALVKGKNAMAPTCAAIRFEGPRVSVDARCEELIAQARSAASVERLDEAASIAFWSHARDAASVRAAAGQIWRASVPPTEGEAFVETVKRAHVPILDYYYDWIGGLIWLAVESAPDAHASAVRSPFERMDGHATLMMAEEATRIAVDVFQPQKPALAALSMRIKDSFDPLRILNRGRLRAGM